ncbi:MAG: hypothetical protein EOP10_16755 [Proteobacteria bacterium]|nr:MAG: hypothetical protein EOP10_16755 [Pseudomonadota bacterium]
MSPLVPKNGVTMEAYRIPTQTKVYSHSALHTFITGSETMAHGPRSKTNPYRKRPGLLSFLGLKDVLDEVRREENELPQQTRTKEQEINWNLARVSEA